MQFSGSSGLLQVGVCMYVCVLSPTTCNPTWGKAGDKEEMNKSNKEKLLSYNNQKTMSL